MNDKHRVVAIAYDHLCLFEFGIAAEIFGLPRPELDLDWYDFRVCGVARSGMRTLGGVRIAVGNTIRLLDSADTIVIPGWTHDQAPPTLISKLVNAHDRGARLISICSGAFLLGEAGLLDGRRATTHWHHVERLQSRFPLAEIVPDVLYVEDGQVLTSAGSAAGIDLCLHVVRSDFGTAVANTVARRLVLPAHRSGGQAQYLDKPVSTGGHALSPMLEWVIEHLTEGHTVSSLAQRAGCSERSLLRRFKSEIGVSPMRWVTEQRINLARQMLEETSLPIGRIAENSGFGTAETLRHHFRASVGVSPVAYRRSFSAG